MSRKTRPSPSVSATNYVTGHIEKGNDGNWWQVRASSDGVKRWVKSGYSQSIPSPKRHQFNIGDQVTVIKAGHGCGPHTLGEVVTIIERGYYSSYPGYKVNPPIGNTKSGDFNGFIGENTFELYKQQVPVIQQTIVNKKPVKLNVMARVKSITKRTTQEVRTIETSLINKEEVFKMLALAEATGLPCLLVGDPGVNSK